MMVYVFGAGGASKGVGALCAALGWHILAFVDNDSSRWGCRHQGVEVRPPDVLFGDEFDLVIVASSYEQDIESQLLSMGLAASQLVFYPGYASRRGVYNLYPDADTPHVWDTLILPISDRCNLSCAHCNKTKGSRRNEPELSVEQFLKRLSSLDPGWFRECCVSGSGEVTLVNGLLGYLRGAKQIGWDNLSIITNGTCRDAGLIGSIVAEGLLQEIAVSVEAAEPGLFRRFRGFDYSRFTAFLALLDESRKRYSSTMRVVFNAPFSKLNISSFPDIVRLAARYGVSHVRAVPMIPLFGVDDAPEGKVCIPGLVYSNYHDEELISSFEASRRVAEELGVEFIDAAGVASSRPVVDEGKRCAEPVLECTDPHRIVRIEIDGNVYPCCQMPNSFSFGNIDRSSFSEILRGDAYRRMRCAIGSGHMSEQPGCRGCPNLKKFS